MHNAALQVCLEAGARHERTLEGVTCTAVASHRGVCQSDTEVHGSNSAGRTRDVGTGDGNMTPTVVTDQTQLCGDTCRTTSPFPPCSRVDSSHPETSVSWSPPSMRTSFTGTPAFLKATSIISD